MLRHRRSISAGSSPVSRVTSSNEYFRLPAREQLVHVAERQPAVLARPLDLLERIALLAQARDDPRVDRAGAGPAAAVVRDHPLLAPAAQGGRRDARLACGLGERQLFRGPLHRGQATRQARARRRRSADARRHQHLVERGVGGLEADECARGVDAPAERAAHLCADRDRRLRDHGHVAGRARKAPRPIASGRFARALARDEDLVCPAGARAARNRNPGRGSSTAQCRTGIDQYSWVEDPLRVDRRLRAGERLGEAARAAGGRTTGGGPGRRRGGG